MDLITKVMQGAYAYLLIGQVLVVSLLTLALIWLIAKRIREMSEGVAAYADIGTDVGATPSISAAAAASVVDNSPLVEELKAKIAQLEAASAAPVAGDDASKGLQDKVKFLESKLLEYEILQEEISTLSALKIENEELKKQLVTGGAPMTASAPTAAAEPVAQTPAPTKEPLAVYIPPQSEAPAAAGDENSPESLENLLQQIDELTKSSTK